MTDIRATPDEIRDRVLQDIRERPSIRPYLGEEPSRDACERGHPVNGVGRGRYCRTCHAEGSQRREGEVDE